MWHPSKRATLAGGPLRRLSRGHSEPVADAEAVEAGNNIVGGNADGSGQSFRLSDTGKHLVDVAESGDHEGGQPPNALQTYEGYKGPGNLIDDDYRGEIKIAVINLGPNPYTFRRGDRIAQMVIVPVVHADFEVVEEFTASVRGEGGFGHTGRH